MQFILLLQETGRWVLGGIKVRGRVSIRVSVWRDIPAKLHTSTHDMYKDYTSHLLSVCPDAQEGNHGQSRAVQHDSADT